MVRKGIAPPKSAQFILCEDVREETRGKLSFMGVFVGDRIELHNPKPLPNNKGVGLLHNLAIAVMFQGGYGKSDVDLIVRGPNGVVVAKGQFIGTEFRRDKTAALVLRFPGFAIPAFGTFVAQLSVRSKTFRYAFMVTEPQKVGTTTATTQ